MNIDSNKMIEQFLEGILIGAKWVLTIKSPDEPDFILWVLSWIPILIVALTIGLKFSKSVSNK